MSVWMKHCFLPPQPRTRPREPKIEVEEGRVVLFGVVVSISFFLLKKVLQTDIVWVAATKQAAVVVG